MTPNLQQKVCHVGATFRLGVLWRIDILSEEALLACFSCSARSESKLES